MGGVEGRAERRMGGEIMRGGRNGEYDGRFWRGEMTGWSKEGSRENYVETGKWEEFREGEWRRQLGADNGDSRRRAHTSTE
jgi:hypothetical protein